MPSALTEQNGCTAVPCSTCNSPQGDPCRKGGDSWPEQANRPHKARRDAALLVRWWDEVGRKNDDAEETK